MNRTRVRSLVFFVVGAALVVGSFALMTVGDGRWGLLLFLLLLAMVPVYQAAHRDFLTGRLLLQAGEPEEAITRFEAFLAKLRRRRVLRALVFSPGIEAMTLNNLGSAAMMLGDLDRSEAWLREALRTDPQSAVACYNLSLLAAHRGDQAEADRLLTEARRLGLPEPAEDEREQPAEHGPTP